MVRQTWHLRGTLLMNNLEMLTQREQLMEDIIAIVDGLGGLSIDTKGELEEILCDAVCRNFPIN